MAAKCYGADKKQYADAGLYLPCNPTAAQNGGHTGCCAPGDGCLTNGLCQGSADAPRNANLFWRDGCTDPTWEDAACPRYCLDVGDPTGSYPAYYCLASQSWCCPTGVGSYNLAAQTINTTCCSISNLQFTAPDPTIYTIAQLKIVSTLIAVSSLTSRSSSTTTLNGSVTSVTQSTPTASGGGTGQSKYGSSSRIVLAVGLPLGIALLIAIGVIAWLVRRRHRTSRPNLSSAPTLEYHQTEANYASHGGTSQVRQKVELPAGREEVELPDNKLQ